jgi:hypothetical protein
LRNHALRPRVLGSVIAAALAAGAVVSVVAPQLRAGAPVDLHAKLAFTPYACHDDSHIPRTYTHGDPNDGTFVVPNGYYYLNVKSGPGCGLGADGRLHLVGHVRAYGEGCPGDQPGQATHCPQPWGSWAKVIEAADNPGWGFELWNTAHTQLLACTGSYSGNGATNCPGTPNLVAVPGDANVEFRYDGPNVDPNGYRFRIANNYDNVLWEVATLDVVPCSTCEPGGFTPTKPPVPAPTPGPTPTPTPTQQPISNVPCTVTISGKQQTGTCSGTFAHQ